MQKSKESNAENNETEENETTKRKARKSRVHFERNERGPWFSSNEHYDYQPSEPEDDAKSGESKEESTRKSKQKEERQKKGKPAAFSSTQSQHRTVSSSVHDYAMHHASHANVETQIHAGVTSRQVSRSYAQLHHDNTRKAEGKAKAKTKADKGNRANNNNISGYAERYQRMLTARSQLANLPVNVTPSMHYASKRTNERVARNETDSHEQGEEPLHLSSQHDREQIATPENRSTEEDVKKSIKSIAESAKEDNTQSEQEMLHSSSTEDEATHTAVVVNEQSSSQEHKTATSELEELSRPEESVQRARIQNNKIHMIGSEKEEKAELSENALVQEVIDDTSIKSDNCEEVEFATTHSSERNDVTFHGVNDITVQMEEEEQEEEEVLPRVMLLPLQSPTSTQRERLARYEQPTVASLMHAE